LKMSTKCTTKLIEQIRPLRERNNPWSVIAESVGVGESTLHFWKNPDSELFVPEFAQMVKEAIEQRKKSKTRADQVKQSQFHKGKKVTNELKNLGPGMPSSSYTKKITVRYAKEVLGLRLKMKMTKAEMRYLCERRVKKLEDWQMVQVKEEISDVEPNQAAVKNVETNTGRDADKWNFKEEHEHGLTGNTLLDIAARMCGKGGK